ncbi:MAG: hypothetical protein R3Y64_05040 [Peptostreptococcaceae bacterium]
MDSEIKKITRLIDEISTMLLKNGCSDLDIKLKREDDLSIVKIVSFDCIFTDEEISDLRDVLNIQRQCEIEGFYWELMGDDINGDELFLVGSMIDSADVYKKDNNLFIDILRRKKRK